MVWVWYHYTHTIWYVVHTYGGMVHHPPCSPFVIHSFTRNTKALLLFIFAMPYHTLHHHTLLLALHFVTTGTIVLSSGTIRYGRV